MFIILLPSSTFPAVSGWEFLVLCAFCKHQVRLTHPPSYMFQEFVSCQEFPLLLLFSLGCSIWKSLIFNLYIEWKWNTKSKNNLSYNARIPVKPITIERKHMSLDQIDFSFCSPMCCKTQATSRAPFRLRDFSSLKNKCWVCPWTALSL